MACSLLLLPVAAAEPYGPAIGVAVLGTGASSGAFSPPPFTAPANFTSVTVTVDDAVGDHTFFSVCVERAGVPNLCSARDGDLQASGVDSVTLTNPTALPAGTPVTVFVYTLHVDASGAAIGTTGTATAVFS